MRIRVVFAGTPAFAIPILNALRAADSAQLIAIYTQPDRRALRGARLQANAVKQWAQANAPKTPLLQPESLRESPQARAHELQQLQPDLLITAAYGLLFPPEMLTIPPHGCVNLHASLLPRWRGAAPIQRAIENGDTETGITLMQMETRLDCGAILAQAPLPITADDTSATLHDKLALLAGELLSTNLPALAAQTLQAQAQPQDESRACTAPKLQKSEATLNWHLPAEVLARKIRAFNPWPIARSHLNQNGEIGAPLHILRAIAEPTPTSKNPPQPGEIIRTQPNGITVATGKGHLRLTEVQQPGGRAMPVSALLAGAANNKKASAAKLPFIPPHRFAPAPAQ